MGRDHLLEIARDTMKEKRPDCQLNWKNYSTIVFLEVLKKNCYIGIFTDWTDRTKYNWQEHHKRKTEAKKSTENAPENVPENAEERIPLEKKDATENVILPTSEPANAPVKTDGTSNITGNKTTEKKG